MRKRLGKKGRSGRGKAGLHDAVDVGAKDATAEDVECIADVADRVSGEGLYARFGYMRGFSREHGHSAP